MTDKNKSDADDIPVIREQSNTHFETILSLRFSRRDVLINTLYIGANAMLAGLAQANSNSTNSNKADTNASNPLTFQELGHGMDASLHVPRNYNYQVLLRWGDPLFEGVDEFDAYHQTASKQARQFGYNNDFVCYLPLAEDVNASKHGLLVVNHEFVSSHLMHTNSATANNLTREQVATEIFAHGLSVVEIKNIAAQKRKRKWQVNLQSKYNRRITPHTKMKVSGPASGDSRMKTHFSADGKTSIGTFANCAGCVTPWGTILTAEENIQAYFTGDARKTSEYENHKRFGLQGDATALSFWGQYHQRWDINQSPQAAMHAGWIVEIDPYNTASVPIKRTALGRCKHEGCGLHINKDNRVVIYMGDDQVSEYIYRFISKDKYIENNHEHNKNLLDHGELSVAEFTQHGTLVWHDLIFGHGPHTQVNGFTSQADVVLDMRHAADLVGATPMDRPEEIKVDPQSGNIFAVMTNNVTRIKINAANPRPLNRHGHILELQPPNKDHSAKEYKWEVFILAGDPTNILAGADYHPDISANGWFSSPDNISFDKNGSLWIASDGFNRHGKADGIWACEVNGNNKARSKYFLRAPDGAEICSPCFTPDQKTMFCSVQHPGAGSSFAAPSTRWPDFEKDVPPRPSVIAVTHATDEIIGS